MKYLRLARRFLRGNTVVATGEPIFRHSKAFQSATLLVRVYYAVIFYFLVTQLGHWSEWLALVEISPLWPVAWVELTGIPTAVHIIMTVSLAAALLSVLFPEKRLFRGLLFFALLEFVAFSNSFGKIGHSWHFWLALGFFFVFLPNGTREQLGASRTDRQRYLTAFWAAQTVVLGFYSMSGLWKFIAGISQLANGEVHAFAYNAFAHQIADRLLQTNSTSLLGPFIIEHPLLGWPLYLSVIYLQIFAFVAAFRPSLHRCWGMFLILFHIGSGLTLSIVFPKSVLLLALFFVCSPFAPPQNSWKAILFDLPLIGLVARKAVGS